MVNCHSILITFVFLISRQKLILKIFSSKSDSLEFPAKKKVLTCTDSDNCMRATLPGGPSDFEKVQTPFISDFGSDTVRWLCHWVTVEGEFIVFLNKNIVGAVVLVPGVFKLHLFGGRGHVH